MLSLEQQNRWRDQYRDLHPGWRPATEVFAVRVRERLNDQFRLLDIGCGRGGLIEQLDHPLRLTTGIDPDFESLREYRLEGVPRAAAFSDWLPFMGDTFDIITAAWLLEHLKDPAATFSSVYRVLRPGGVFVFITPNARHPLTWANRVAGRFGRFQTSLVDRIYGRAAGDTFPTYYRANSLQTLKLQLTRAGFVMDRTDFVADPSYVAFNEFLFRFMSAVDDGLAEERRIHLVGVARKPDEKSA